MNVQYRMMLSGEENAVCHLVEDCFNEFVAPEYSEEGVREFFKYVNPSALRDRSQKSHFVLVALEGDKVAGMIEIRINNHISLLFVKSEYQNKGIAKNLLRFSLNSCTKANPCPEYIDVNSSPYAVKIYERLGFTRIGKEQEINGIRFTPMRLSLT